MKKIFLVLIVLCGSLGAQTNFWAVDTLAITTTETDTTFTTHPYVLEVYADGADIYYKASADTSLQGQDWDIIPDGRSINFGFGVKVNRISLKTRSGSATARLRQYRGKKSW